MSTENKEIIRRLIDEVWNQREIHVLDEIIAADAFIHSPTVPNLSHGPEGAKQYVQLFWAAFPDLRVSIEEIIAEGDSLAVRITWQGTHEGEFMGVPPTGKSIVSSGVDILHVRHDKVVEAWHYSDDSAVRQIGSAR